MWPTTLYNSLPLSLVRTCELFLINRIWLKWWDITHFHNLCYIKLDSEPDIEFPKFQWLQIYNYLKFIN